MVCCRGQAGISGDKGGVPGKSLHGHIIRVLDDSPNNMLFWRGFWDAAQLASIVMAMVDVDENQVGVMVEPRICVAPVYPSLSDHRRIREAEKAKGGTLSSKGIFDA
jgi:cephalosporin-C deacetylase